MCGLEGVSSGDVFHTLTCGRRRRSRKVAFRDTPRVDVETKADRMLAAEDRLMAGEINASDAAGRTWDVAIVGGGPAGAMAALHLAQAGRSVLVLERASFPREKVCGDALIPDAIRVLRRAGILQKVQDRAFPSASLRLFSASQAELLIPLEALTIKRSILDHIIINAATEAGAVLVQGHVSRIGEGLPAHVFVRGVDRPLTAQVVIVATGADIGLLAQMGMVQRAEPSIIAVRRYIRSTTTLQDLVISFDHAIAPGYAWLFPLGSGEYNVGCGIAWGSRHINLAAYLERFIREFRPLRGFAATIISQEPLRGARLRCGLLGTSQWRAPNILAIGESIGTTFHLTGEGIGKAMESAEQVAAVVLQALDDRDFSILSTFQGNVEGLRNRYRGYEKAQQWLSRPWVGNAIARLAHRSPRTVACMSGILNETFDPQEIFSMRGIWNILTR